MNKTSEKYKEFRRKANIISRKYYSKHKNKIKKWHKEYRKNNKEKISEYQKNHYKKPEVQLRIKKWREKNKEYLKEYRTKYSGENLEEKRKYDREYSKRIWKDSTLRQKQIKRQTLFRKNHPDKVKKHKKKYYQSSKGQLQYKKYNHLRISRNHNCKFQLTKEQIKQIYDRDGCCVYCGSSKNLELDHIIPLVKGGEGIFYNYVLACKDCNCSKNRRDVFYWCKLKNKKVPEIVIECLDEQKKLVNL